MAGPMVQYWMGVDSVAGSMVGASTPLMMTDGVVRLKSPDSPFDLAQLSRKSRSDGGSKSDIMAAVLMSNAPPRDGDLL
jgi:hypothetical protein